MAVPAGVRPESELLGCIPELARPWTIVALIAKLEVDRGRAIVIRDLPTVIDRSGKFCGLWVATDTTDYVFVDAGGGELRRIHVLLHELAHIILKHEQPAVSVAVELLPDLDPQLIRQVLGRNAYDDCREYEAELLATHMLRMIETPTCEDLPDIVRLFG